MTPPPKKWKSDNGNVQWENVIKIKIKISCTYIVE